MTIDLDIDVHLLTQISIASIMHYTLVLSPEGPTMLRMLSSVHNLIPYTIIRQALKVGNVSKAVDRRHALACVSHQARTHSLRC